MSLPANALRRLAEKALACRERAEEIRAIRDTMTSPDTRGLLDRLAESWDDVADRLDLVLSQERPAVRRRVGRARQGAPGELLWLMTDELERGPLAAFNGEMVKAGQLFRLAPVPGGGFRLHREPQDEDCGADLLLLGDVTEEQEAVVRARVWLTRTGRL